MPKWFMRQRGTASRHAHASLLAWHMSTEMNPCEGCNKRASESECWSDKHIVVVSSRCDDMMVGRKLDRPGQASLSNTYSFDQ